MANQEHVARLNEAWRLLLLALGRNKIELRNLAICHPVYISW